MAETRCDIIIPVWNKPDLTRDCLDSIKGHTDIPYSIILIDNASDEPTKKFLEEFKAANRNTVLIRNTENAGWVKAVNQGMKLSRAPYICVMNNDTVVRTDGWLSRLIEIAESDKDIGLVNPYFDVKGRRVKSEKPYEETDFCRGYCILIKRAVVERVGFLDESYGMGYYDDDDYSMRALGAGFRCVRANGVLVEHLRDSTFASVFSRDGMSALHEKNKKLFVSKWGRRLRIVFIVTKESGRGIADILLAQARRQHIVYLWNSGAPLEIEHTNITENRYGPFMRGAAFWLRLFFNGLKSTPKKYDMVFVDSPALKLVLSSVRRGVYYIDPEKDAKKVDETVFLSSRKP